MALGAMANDPSVKVKIVPVGLTYFHPERFRSRLVVEFGSALDVPPQLVEMFKSGGDQKREAVAKLLDMIYNGLKTVTLRAPDFDTLMVRASVDYILKVLTLKIGHPSRSPTLWDTWPAFDPQSSR
jgi:glycerol-3-phosphate O-acyltransferase / dihydroxyacetone phosphate acyltransferase